MIVWADKNQTSIVREMGHRPRVLRFDPYCLCFKSQVLWSLKTSHFQFASGISSASLHFEPPLRHDNNSIVSGLRSFGGERSDARAGKSVAFSRQNGGASGGWGVNRQPAQYLWVLEQKAAWLRASHTSLQTFINSRENVAPIFQLTTFGNARSVRLALPFILLFPFIASAFSATVIFPLTLCLLSTSISLGFLACF